MWQRIQTVFLILAIISLVAAILFPIWVHEAVGQTHKLFALHYSITGQSGEMITTQYMPYSTTAILAIASITLSGSGRTTLCVQASKGFPSTTMSSSLSKSIAV